MSSVEYLEKILIKIKNKITEVEQDIEDVRKDIHEMNDYYWENYNEMDEYGYENFDNQQALLMQADANQVHKETRRKLIKMLDSPFFGSVTFKYDDDEDEDAETFYIGIGNFSEKRGDVPLIYDWRAPVSGLFYDYDKGPGSYEAPGGTMTGEVITKWQYKIKKGHMVYEFESDVKIDDEILKEELGKPGEVKLKNIIRTIQKEQNAIIRNTKDKVMIIQGAAGSGKTSIALHRIAYLLYHDRKHLKANNVLILSPNSVFADYISHILPELGEENIREMSLDVFAYHELKDIVNDTEDRYHQLEREIENGPDEACRYKLSEALTEDMEVFLLGLEDELLEFKDITYKKLTMEAKELRELFYEKFGSLPLLSRMKALQDRFIDEYETLYGNIPEEDEFLLREEFDSMLETKDIYTIYNWFLADYGFEPLPDVEPEKRVLPYQDVYPMLYLRYKLCGSTAHRHVRHLVIDEMQDYDYLQYRILQMLFNCDKTILGDRAQTLDGEVRDVREFLPKLLGKNIRTIEMNKSYRNTSEISAYADRIGHVEGVSYIDREGKPVEEVEGLGYEEIAADICNKCKVGNVSAGGIDYETAAILTMTEEEAKTMYGLLKAERDDVYYIDRDSRNFNKGITVTTWYMAKGLEFDQVYVMPADEKSAFYTQYQYICATRALHELVVYK